MSGALLDLWPCGWTQVNMGLGRGSRGSKHSHPSSEMDLFLGLDFTKRCLACELGPEITWGIVFCSAISLEYEV